ncbi:MAG: response regulator [Thiogranum sp.]|nr:response regulator [Thiogranum sp.]
MKEDRERYSQVGCDAFLSKPVDQEQLRQVLQDFLSGSGADRDKVRSADCEADAKYQALVGRFIEGLEEYGTRMAVALDESRFDVVRDLAHQLKGMGGSFGYPAVIERAAELEVCLRSDDQQCASKAGRSFIAFLENIRRGALETDSARSTVCRNVYSD